MESRVIGPGVYQYEFFKDRIAVAEWDEPPMSTTQWVIINLGHGKATKFKLVGTCNEDICVIPYDDHESPRLEKK